MQVCSGTHLLRSLVRRRAVTCAAAAASGAHTSTAPPPPKAAVLVIGDEILKGSIADSNVPWLAKLLHSRGMDLVRVEFVPDDVADIAASVAALSARVGPGGALFTSGGIGPTHDDKTYAAVAQAFGLSLQLHEPTVERMREHYTQRGLELNAARLRMATLPAPAEVLFTPGLWVPLVCVARHVYVLPGIPRLFQAMVGAHRERFQGPAAHEAMLFTDQGEGDIADPLALVAAQHPQVSIGSYPNTSEAQQQAYKVKLALSSRDPDALAAAVAELRRALPHSRDDP